jgi:hypothetical protein
MFLDELNLKDKTVFEADIDLTLNGRKILYESKVLIEIHDSYFKLILFNEEGISILPKLFDSRADIFSNESPHSLTVAGITETCSYKATIFPK